MQPFLSVENLLEITKKLCPNNQKIFQPKILLENGEYSETFHAAPTRKISKNILKNFLTINISNWLAAVLQTNQITVVGLPGTGKKYTNIQNSNLKRSMPNYENSFEIFHANFTKLEYVSAFFKNFSLESHPELKSIFNVYLQLDKKHHSNQISAKNVQDTKFYQEVRVLFRNSVELAFNLFETSQKNKNNLGRNLSSVVTHHHLIASLSTLEDIFKTFKPIYKSISLFYKTVFVTFTGKVDSNLLNFEILNSIKNNLKILNKIYEKSEKFNQYNLPGMKSLAAGVLSEAASADKNHAKMQPGDSSAGVSNIPATCLTPDNFLFASIKLPKLGLFYQENSHFQTLMKKIYILLNNETSKVVIIQSVSTGMLRHQFLKKLSQKVFNFILIDYKNSVIRKSDIFPMGEKSKFSNFKNMDKYPTYNESIKRLFTLATSRRVIFCIRYERLPEKYRILINHVHVCTRSKNGAKMALKWTQKWA